MKCEENKMDEKTRKNRKKLDEKAEVCRKADDSVEYEGTIGNEKDWNSEIEKCQPGSVYYNRVYGKMEVVAAEDEYIYLRILDRKGCDPVFLEKNNTIVEIDGRDEEAKEFSLFSIGRWLFPEKEDVDTSDASNVHSIFK